MKNSLQQRDTTSSCLNSSKKILILSDFHSGHVLGLSSKSDCVNNYQKTAWKFFIEGIKKYAPYDIIFCNGDLIDGKNPKDGGKECITTDLQEQSEITSRVIKEIIKVNKKEPKIFFTYGTPYHVSGDCNFENLIASQFRKSIKEKNIDNRLLIKVNDITFDLRHKVGSSNMPHTKLSSVGREILFGMLKESAEGREKADVYIRSHVHYFVKVEMMNRIAIIHTSPSNQQQLWC